MAQRREAPQGDGKDKAIGKQQQIPVILRVRVEIKGPARQLSGFATRVEKDPREGSEEDEKFSSR